MSSDPTKISAQPPPAQMETGEACAAITANAALESVTSFPETQEQQSVSATRKGKARISKGEHMFNWMAYGGFAGVVTFLLSLPLGYWARYSNGGKQTIKWAAGHVKNVGLTEQSAEDIVMTTALMQGGNLTMLPIKLMESKKSELVDKFNSKLGDSCDPEETLVKKQSWGSILKSRTIAWGAVYFSLRGAAHVAGKEKFNEFEEAFSRELVCKPLGLATHIAQKETRAYRIGRIAAIDIFASAAAASLLYLGTRLFGKDENKEEVEKSTLSSPPSLSISSEAVINSPAATADPAHSAKFTRKDSFAEQYATQAESSHQLAH